MITSAEKMIGEKRYDEAINMYKQVLLISDEVEYMNKLDELEDINKKYILENQFNYLVSDINEMINTEQFDVAVDKFLELNKNESWVELSDVDTKRVISEQEEKLVDSLMKELHKGFKIKDSSLIINMKEFIVKLNTKMITDNEIENAIIEEIKSSIRIAQKEENVESLDKAQNIYEFILKLDNNPVAMQGLKRIQNIKIKQEENEIKELLNNKNHDSYNLLMDKYKKSNLDIYWFVNIKRDKFNSDQFGNDFYGKFEEINPDYNGTFANEIKKFVLSFISEKKWREEYDYNQEIKREVDKRFAEEATKKEPAIGMTAAEVRISKWGSPKENNKTTLESIVFEQWVYSIDRYIYLENGIVTAIQR
ncbi:MAG TPA: hypothetical protein VGI33_13690 [Paenibacillus sp.]|jgi:hypothetical protein